MIKVAEDKRHEKADSYFLDRIPGVRSFYQFRVHKNGSKAERIAGYAG